MVKREMSDQLVLLDHPGYGVLMANKELLVLLVLWVVIGPPGLDGAKVNTHTVSRLLLFILLV